MQLDLIERPAITRRTALDRARSKADAAIERAARGAEREIPGWCDMAAEALRKFAAHQAGLFTCEMARGVIELQHLVPEPREKRSWGKAVRMAVARGYIEPVKGMYFPAVSSNGAAKVCYRRPA